MSHNAAYLTTQHVSERSVSHNAVYLTTQRISQRNSDRSDRTNTALLALMPPILRVSELMNPDREPLPYWISKSVPLACGRRHMAAKWVGNGAGAWLWPKRAFIQVARYGVEQLGAVESSSNGSYKQWSP